MKKYYKIEVSSLVSGTSEIFVIRPKSLSSFVDKCLSSGLFVFVKSVVHLPDLDDI